MHAQTHAPQLRGVPRGQASRSGDFCGCHNLGVLWWVEARDAAQHPTMHRAVVPHLCCKELSAQKVHSAEDKNPWFRSKKQFSLWGGKAAPGSGLTRAAGLEASRCSHHPLGTSGRGGGDGYVMEELTPLQGQVQGLGQTSLQELQVLPRGKPATDAIMGLWVLRPQGVVRTDLQARGSWSLSELLALRFSPIVARPQLLDEPSNGEC